MKSDGNKWLIIKTGVVLTEHIDPVIFALDDFFMDANLKAYVTSGLRRPEDQLRIIRNELNRRGLSQYYQDAHREISYKTTYEGEEVYGWAPGWSKLLSVGFIVNPPYPAKCLMDYFRPGSDENRKGKIIGDSPHTRGTAFDIGGGSDGLTNELTIVQGAIGHIKGLKGYLLERNQNCLHCDVTPIDMENFN